MVGLLDYVNSKVEERKTEVEENEVDIEDTKEIITQFEERKRMEFTLMEKGH